MTKALAEQGITNANIEIDHIRGKTFVKGIEFGIKYPLEYVENINKLSKEKIYDYCFLGKFGKERGELLEPFMTEKSKIEDNRKGRDTKVKFNFDTDYFQTISNTKYSLCPNQGSTEKYNHDYGWTYRLIETVLCKSIPIAFRATPYGTKFIKDIEFLWDDDVHNLSDKQYSSIVESNYRKGLEYWTLHTDEIEKIRFN
jgi:hypothetical protein